MAFFDDTKQLVAEGVRSDVARRILEASPEVKIVEAEHGKTREANLKKWLKMERPLTYGQRDEGETYSALLLAVVSKKEDLSKGLPNRGKVPMSKATFVDILLNMSTPSSPAPISAPVLKNGSFHPILLEVHHRLCSLSGDRSPSGQRAFVHTHFIRAVDHLKIRFIPFHMPPPPPRDGGGRGGGGAPWSKLIFNAWRHLGLWEPRTDLSFPLHEPSLPSSEQAVAAAHASALAGDSNADWYVKDITLSNLHTVLHFTRLPLDFGHISDGKAPYVTDSNAWVRANYDGTKPTHHFALIVAIIASLMLPCLFLPEDPSLPGRFAETTTKEEVRLLYNSIPWVERSKTKGMKDTSIFIAMFTVFIIALYEPDSPLSKHVAASPKKGLGDPWTLKYCMSSKFLLVFGRSLDRLLVLQLLKVSRLTHLFILERCGVWVLVLSISTNMVRVGVAMIPSM